MRTNRPMQIHPGSRRARGFSLVELMLALALGVVVTAGIIQLFVGNNQTYLVLNGQSRLQENARYGFDFIGRAARSAGFYGCAPEDNNFVKGLRGAWNLLYEFDAMNAVQGHEATGTTWSPSLSTLPRTEGGTNLNVFVNGNGIDSSRVQQGTDVLTVRGLRGRAYRLAQTLQPTADPVIAVPGGDLDIRVDDMVVVSDCEQGALFRVNGVAIAGNEATLVINTSSTGNFYENADTIDSPAGAIPFTLSFLGSSYGEDAMVSQIETSIFYIAPSAGVNNRGNTPLALWQKVGAAAPVELIQGVEDMQIRYGVDLTLTDGISNVSQYMDFDDVPDPSQIVTMLISLTVNSVDAVTGVGDGLLRRTFTETVLVRNARPEA